jgi:hypothetical protein
MSHDDEGGERTAIAAPRWRGGEQDIRKAAEVIMARQLGELELIDRKTFTYLLSRTMPNLHRGEDAVHKVPVSDVLGFLGHGSTDRLYESLKRLGSVNIEIDYVDEAGHKHSAGARYLSYDLTRHPDGWVEFAYDPILLRFLHKPKVYAIMSSRTVQLFRSDYAAQLYEIMSLHTQRRYPCWEPSLEEFREALRVGDGYGRFDNLRRRVIDVAVEEVNKLAPFNVDVEDVRAGKGGRVIGLRFTAVQKGPRTLAGLSEAAPAQMPRARRGRLGRDPNTRDLIDGKADAERDPLEVGEDALLAAVEMNDGQPIDAHLDHWRERMRGRRMRDPGRTFLHWLEIRLAKEREEAPELAILDDDAISALVENWEDGR